MDVTQAQAQLDAAIKESLAADRAREVAQGAVIAARQALAQAQADLADQLALGTIREVSVVDEAAAAEREAGQAAVIALIKSNPKVTQAEAMEAWKAAALTVRPAGRRWLLHEPGNLLLEYEANLVATGQIKESTWEEFAAWVALTPVEAIQATQGYPPIQIL